MNYATAGRLHTNKRFARIYAKTGRLSTAYEVEQAIDMIDQSA